jgi:3D (Asp-Asp-Asp) domain-containing protein
VVVTAYSSTPEQTDDTPFITASGTKVREGIVAANFLPIGTKIKLPDLYGDKIFVVEDRMHPRKHYMVDIWFANYTEAKEFGAKLTYVQVLES